MPDSTAPLYGRDEAVAGRISTAQLLAQVSFLVAVALGFCALGTYIGRDLSSGTSTVLFLVGIGMLFASSFAGRRFRVGAFAIGWLYAVALLLGLGLGPTIRHFAEADQSALTSAAGATALTVAAMASLGFVLSKDLAPWMRPLSIPSRTCRRVISQRNTFGAEPSPFVVSAMVLMHSLVSQRVALVSHHVAARCQSLA